MRNVQNKCVTVNECISPAMCKSSIKIEAVKFMGPYFMMPPRRVKFTKHAAKGRGRAGKQASVTPSPPTLLYLSEDEGDEPLDLDVIQERTQSQERVEKQQSREHAETRQIEHHRTRNVYTG